MEEGKFEEGMLVVVGGELGEEKGIGKEGVGMMWELIE